MLNKINILQLSNLFDDRYLKIGVCWDNIDELELEQVRPPLKYLTRTLWPD